MSRDHTQPVVADPLGAIRTELVGAARRRRTARRRRRRAATVVAAVVGLLAAAGGAIAVTNTETGVPAIDRLLDSIPRNAPEPAGDPQQGHEPLPPGVEPPPIPDVRPAAGSVSPPFEVPLGDGRRAVAVGYMSSDGMVCAALAEPEAPAKPPRGGVGCLSTKLLADSLAADGGRIAGGGGVSSADGTATEAIAVHGFARADVQAVTITGPDGRVDAALSEAWTPGPPIDEPIRVFYGVVGTTDVREVVGQRLELRFADGTTREVGP